jgi:uncharacterized protein (DUF697 family)
VVVNDPYVTLKRVVGYVVTIVWAISFLAAIVLPSHDDTVLIAVQAAMMLIAGALYGEAVWRGGRGRRR